MKFLNTIIIFSFLLSSINLRAQSNVIAKIGNNELTKEEFGLRYELSPKILSNDLDNSDSLKLKFLYSIVAEKLWAMEAMDKGLTNSDAFNFYYAPIEKSYIRDEVFRLEIKDKVKVTNDDISKGMANYLKILKIKTFASDDSSSIANLYAETMNLGSIDSLSIINPDTLIQISELEIKFGDLNNEMIEDRLYNLKKNEFTEPIQNGNGWFIFDLVSTKLNIPEVSQNKLEDDVEKIIRNRRTRNLYDDFYKKHFGSFTFKADDKIFIEISEAFYNEIISRLNSSPQENIDEKYYLTEQDILNVKGLLGSEFMLNELFNTAYGPVKVYDFFSNLTIVDVSFNEVNQTVVNKVLSNELKRIMQQEYIYQIGVEMGVQYSEDVKSQLELWRDNLLAQILKNDNNSQIVVTDGEIDQYYNDFFSDSLKVTQLNLQLLTTSDFEQVKLLLDLIENENSFDQIAKEFDSNQSVYLENISDFSRLKEFGQAMDIITELDTGEIYGPIKTTNGYTLVKVVEKSVIPDSIKQEIHSRRDDIYQKLFYQKLNQLLEDKTIDLANKYGIVISEDFIYYERYSDVNIFAHRYLGFGGRIAAVPFTTPFFRWYYGWKTNSKINP